MAAPAPPPVPSHVYAAAGVYTVSLTVTGPGGSNTQTRTNYVTVTTAAPVAQFTGSPDLRDVPADGRLQQHLDRQHHQLRLDLRRWRHQHRWRVRATCYAAAGIYTVSLTVTGPGGSNTQTRTNYVTVTTAAPVAQFTGSPTSGDVPADGQLQQHLDRQHHQLRLDLRRWRHQHAGELRATCYAAAGIYTVSLTVTGPGGSNTQTRTNYVTVDHRGPGGAVHRQPRPPGTFPLTVDFSNTSTGSITSYAWTFGDGGTSTVAQSQPHLCGGRDLHGEPDGHRSGGSNTQTRSNYVTVTTAAPVAQFTGSPDLGQFPADGRLQQHLDRQHHQLRLDLRRWRHQHASRAPATCYAAAGIYTVSLTVTGPGGSNTQTRTNYVTVTTAAPVAQFTGSPDLGHVPADGRPSATPRPAASPATPGPSAMAAPARVASSEPHLRGRRHLHGEPHGHRSRRQQHADAHQLRDGHRPQHRWRSSPAAPTSGSSR